MCVAHLCIKAYVSGNGGGAGCCDEIGRLAVRLLLGQEWDFPAPQSLFKMVTTKPAANL